MGSQLAACALQGPMAMTTASAGSTSCPTVTPAAGHAPRHPVSNSGIPTARSSGHPPPLPTGLAAPRAPAITATSK